MKIRPSVLVSDLATKISASLLFVLTIAGCKVTPDRIEDATVVKVAGFFITEYGRSSLNFRVKGVSKVKKKGNSLFYVSGSVEGFSSYNAPFSIEHFNETVRYSGGDFNNVKNWNCLDIYIAKKRIK